MVVRPDFRDVEPFLQRLAGLGEKFESFNNQDWSHLKNQEDFQKVYSLPPDQRYKYEDLYAEGRNCAGYMSMHLRDFNDYGAYPTFADYIDSFPETWVYKYEKSQKFIDEVKNLSKENKETPWAVRQMISLFEDQLKLLEAVRNTVSQLKNSHTYLVDKGKAPMEKINSITIGSINNGKVNINSTDNSINYSSNTTEVFTNLATAVKNSEMQDYEKEKLIECIRTLEQAKGGTGYVERYKEFMKTAATHMSVVGPFLPALAGLLA